MSLWSFPFDFGVCRSKVWYLRCGHQIFNINSTDPEMVVTNTKAAFHDRKCKVPKVFSSVEVHGKLREGAWLGRS